MASRRTWMRLHLRSLQMSLSMCNQLSGTRRTHTNCSSASQCRKANSRGCERPCPGCPRPGSRNANLRPQRLGPRRAARIQHVVRDEADEGEAMGCLLSTLPRMLRLSHLF
jgi:hypothetical protein